MKSAGTQADQSTAEPVELADQAEACRILGGSARPITRSTLYRGIHAGIYPRPIKIGAMSRWVVPELYAAIRARIAERDTEAA